MLFLVICVFVCRAYHTFTNVVLLSMRDGTSIAVSKILFHSITQKSHCKGADLSMYKCQQISSCLPVVWSFQPPQTAFDINTTKMPAAFCGECQHLPPYKRVLLIIISHCRNESYISADAKHLATQRTVEFCILLEHSQLVHGHALSALLKEPNNVYIGLMAPLYCTVEPPPSPPPFPRVRETVQTSNSQVVIFCLKLSLLCMHDRN